MKAFQGLSSVVVLVSTLEEKSDCVYTTHYLAGTETLKIFIYSLYREKLIILNHLNLDLTGTRPPGPSWYAKQTVNIRQCPDKCL